VIKIKKVDTKEKRTTIQTTKLEIKEKKSK